MKYLGTHITFMEMHVSHVGTSMPMREWDQVTPLKGLAISQGDRLARLHLDV